MEGDPSSSKLQTDLATTYSNLGITLLEMEDPEAEMAGKEYMNGEPMDDDFEEMELHSTILIDARGRVHWKRTGGDPFSDMDFLLTEVKRMNKAAGSSGVAR